ncbi:hypothetical protein IHE44_0012665 [Lamprotornis superbus]|uniref:Uncharacterized protein n=1 Tax=Lamprotornis superbus TaxID=245042 RepID=A0A835NKQ2_9PASS|nr:hypothetical protein IHE44_0012665 [Lamprotornis superbus]
MSKKWVGRLLLLPAWLVIVILLPTMLPAALDGFQLLYTQILIEGDFNSDPSLIAIILSVIRVDGTTKNTLEYEIVQVVDTGPILRDMAFSMDHEHLYIMSEKQNLGHITTSSPSLPHLEAEKRPGKVLHYGKLREPSSYSQGRQGQVQQPDSRVLPRQWSGNERIGFEEGTRGSKKVQKPVTTMDTGKNVDVGASSKTPMVSMGMECLANISIWEGP